MSRRLRIGLAGAGMVSRYHLIAWRHCAAAEVVAIADPDLSAAERRAAEFAVPRVFSDAERMLAGDGIDALDIAAPIAAHGPLVALAAARGIATLCQKPFAATAAEARRIADVAAAAPIRLMVHENWRFRPHYRQIAEWLAAGRIGVPHAFHLSALSSSLLPAGNEPPPGLVRQPFLAQMERLIVLEVLVHHFDTLTFLFGPLAVAAAHIARLSPHVVGEDTASIALAGDAIAGTVFASMAAAGHPPRGIDCLEILGDAGRISIGPAGLRCDSPRPANLLVDFETDYQAAYVGVITHFAEAILAGEPFETPPEVHIPILEMVEAVYASARVPASVTEPKPRHRGHKRE